MKSENKFSSFNFGDYPGNDGWSFFYKVYALFIKPVKPLRSLVRLYFIPNNFERTGRRKFYRKLGIDVIGKFIPTGGSTIRKLTGARMKPYTLKSNSLDSAREFFFRTCIFELLHFPFFIALTIIIIDRFANGQTQFAMENLVMNIIFNIIPIMHHRNTRTRIFNLLILAGK